MTTATDLQFSAFLGLQESVKASKACATAVDEFQKAVTARDWPAAEHWRIVVVGATEAYLDAFMSAHRAMQKAG